MGGQKSEVAVISPPEYSTSDQMGSSQQTKSRSTVKFVVIGVTAVCLTAIVVIGFVVGFHYQSATAKTAKKEYKTVTSKGVEETIEQPDEFTKLYTVRTETGTYKVLYDFNKNIRIMKKETHCVVVPMNSTDVDPETMSERHMTTKEEMTVYKRDNVPIKDTSVLGSAGEDLCRGELVYWGFPTCPTEGDYNVAYNSSSGLQAPREKRDVFLANAYFISSCPPYQSTCSPRYPYRCCLACGDYALSSNCVELYLLLYCDDVARVCWYQCYFILC
jgi:hypothetical protein